MPFLYYIISAGFTSLILIQMIIWLKLKQQAHVSSSLVDIKLQFNLHQDQLKSQLTQELQTLQHALQTYFHQLELKLSQESAQHRETANQYHLEQLKTLIASQRETGLNLQQHILATLSYHAQNLDGKMALLTEHTQKELSAISRQVDQRLNDGFAKTQQTFTDIVQRLALIDAAQQKITELSSHVVGLQEILADKRSRGTFGEIQLGALIRNVIPAAHFGEQVTLSNNKRVDYLLYLPAPTGNIPIDAKFPLESFRIMTDIERSEPERKLAQQQFIQDIKKHIHDISEKYIIPGETSDSAMMFIPAEAIFAEIHGHYPELIEYAYQAKIWLVSPTTFMAVLTTARAVLKDAETRQQIHIIQEHLGLLAKDFSRFQTRMDKLGRHLEQANADVKEIHTTARKITNRFGQIEKVEFDQEILLE